MTAPKHDSRGEVLGIIGGLGPMATAVFIRRIILMTDAASDQEHIRMFICHEPDIPDRTAHILDNAAPDPTERLLLAAKRLEAEGAAEIAIPCVTVQYYHSRIQSGLGVPLLNGVSETADYLADIGVEGVGILATDGTVHSGLFEPALSAKGIRCFYPSSDEQAKVMSLIYDSVKAGRPADFSVLKTAADEVRSLGAQRIILGCTELSVARDGHEIPSEYIDVLDIMARRCVLDFAALRSEYEVI